MPSLPWLLLILCSLAQTPESPNPPPPNTQEPAAQPENSTPVPTEQPVEAIPDEPPTEFDKLIEEAADAIDALDYVSADMLQIIHAGQREIPSKGLFQKGPDNRLRVELKVDLGESVGDKLYVSDGETGFSYERILDGQRAHSVKLEPILESLKRKEMTPQVRRQFAGQIQLPYLRAGDMLRGLPQTLTFTASSSGTLGDRRVTVVEGHWRKKVAAALAQNPAAEAKTLQGNLPQYVRVFLDEQTKWPLRIELFRRDDKQELKPIYTMEYQNPRFHDKLDDAVFQFQPPDDLEVRDVTDDLLTLLDRIPDKATDNVSAPLSPADAPKEEAAPATSEPLPPPTP